MKTTINLVKRNQVVKRRLRRYFIVSLGVFFVIFGVTAALYLYSITVNFQLSSLVEEELSLTSQIQTFASKKDKSLVLQERIGSVRGILAERKAIPDDVEKLRSIVPPGAEVLTVSAKDGESTFRIKSNSLSELNSLIDEKIAEVTSQEGNTIQEVVISSFVLDAENLEYSVSLQFVYKT